MTETSIAQELVFSLAASPEFTQDSICFAGCGSGLYRSADGGKTWHFAYESLNPSRPLATQAVAVSPNFAVDQTVFTGVSGGTLRSFDGGNTWHISLLPEPSPTVVNLIFSPNYQIDGNVFAGTLEDGVFLSPDGGENWVLWNFGLYDVHILCMAVSPDFAEDQTLYVGTEIGIFYSTNRGRSWNETTLPVNDPVLSLALSPGYATDGIVLAGTETQGLYISRDRGASWSRLGSHAIDGNAVNHIILSSEYPAGQKILLLLSDGLLVSQDDGNSWSEEATGLNFEHGTSCIAAPQGLAAADPLLIGLVEKGVVTTQLSLAT